VVHGLSELVGRARAGQLTEAELLAGIARAEFSEWNEIFLYVLARFRQGEPEFQHAAAVVHQHKRHIEARLGTSAPLPPVWQERVLVVDDEEALRLLLREVLGEFGAVTLAANGAEALAQARDKFFDVIVTDVDMPAMTGPEFYRALAATGSPHCRRFIFMTGRTTPVVANLAAEAGALLLEKPFSLRALTDAVRGVLARAG